MITILAERRLVAGARAFGALTWCHTPAIVETQRSVCFSEVPLDRLDRLVERRRTSYGIGFRQDFLTQAGGGRVWYVDNNGELARTLRSYVNAAHGSPVDLQNPILRITPFVDYPGDYAGGPYRFEWEREWRVPRELRFGPDDVAFLFIPETHHDRARESLEDAHENHTGPAYVCPYIDPLWRDPEIQAAVAAVAPPAPLARPPLSYYPPSGCARPGTSRRIG